MVTPLVRGTEVAIPIGHYTYRENIPAYRHEYHALLLSEPHYRYQSGYWSGGGPLFVEHSSQQHYGEIWMPEYFYFGINYGPTRYLGVGPYSARMPKFAENKNLSGYGEPLASVGRDVAGARAYLEALQNAHYTPGILRTRPGEATANLGQFLVELRDFPRLPGKELFRALRGLPFRQLGSAIQNRARGFLGASASEYLNYEFGWRPFVADLRGLYRLLKHIDGQLAKLIAENGKNIRRRAHFGTTVTVEPIAAWHGLSWPYPVFGCGGAGSSAGANGRSFYTATRRTRTETWFSAGYRYWIADTSSWLWRGRAVAALFGVLPTPGLIWAVTPWSWLADWLTDLGDLYDLYSPNAVDHLVTRYAYTMRTKVTTEDWTCSTHITPQNTSFRRWRGGASQLRSIYEKITKARGFGHAPFGTILGSKGLSPKQLGILAALGVSRATR